MKELDDIIEELKKKVESDVINSFVQDIIDGKDITKYINTEDQTKLAAVVMSMLYDLSFKGVIGVVDNKGKKIDMQPIDPTCIMIDAVPSLFIQSTST